MKTEIWSWSNLWKGELLNFCGWRRWLGEAVGVIVFYQGDRFNSKSFQSTYIELQADGDSGPCMKAVNFTIFCFKASPQLLVILPLSGWEWSLVCCSWVVAWDEQGEDPGLWRQLGRRGGDRRGGSRRILGQPGRDITPRFWWTGWNSSVIVLPKPSFTSSSPETSPDSPPVNDGISPPASRISQFGSKVSRLYSSWSSQLPQPTKARRRKIRRGTLLFMGRLLKKLNISHKRGWGINY